jgi:plastocyanin
MSMAARRLAGALFLIALLAATVFAACDDDDDGREPAITPTPSGGGTLTVQSQDNNYSETSLEVTAGNEATIVLDNRGANPHTLTVYEDAQYTEQVDGATTEAVPPARSGEFSYTFEAGEYFFRCEVHPSQMQGTITAME